VSCAHNCRTRSLPRNRAGFYCPRAPPPREIALQPGARTRPANRRAIPLSSSTPILRHVARITAVRDRNETGPTSQQRRDVIPRSGKAQCDRERGLKPSPPQRPYCPAACTHVRAGPASSAGWAAGRLHDSIPAPRWDAWTIASSPATGCGWITISVQYLLPDLSSSSGVTSSHKTQPFAIVNICKNVSRRRRKNTSKQIFGGQFRRPPAFDALTVRNQKKQFKIQTRPGGRSITSHTAPLTCGPETVPSPPAIGNGAVAASPAVPRCPATGRSRSPQPAPRLYSLPPFISPPIRDISIELITHTVTAAGKGSSAYQSESS
jgi:hypothetical protein